MVVLTSFTPPTEGIKHEQPSTTLFMNNREVGIGSLYIAESALSWRNNSSGEGFSLLYPHIALHAVSRDTEKFGNECLYIMVDTSIEEVNVNEDEEESDENSETGMTEMRFVPADKGQLDAMYRAMTHCQSLHPDNQDELSDGDIYEDADEEGHYNLAGGDSGYIDGHAGLESSNGHNEEDMETEGQFEDAEDED